MGAALEKIFIFLKFVRKWTGLIIAFATLIPFIFKSFYLNALMNIGNLGDYDLDTRINR